MGKYTFMLALLLPISFLLSAQTSIISFGAEWEYQDNGTDLGTAWRSTSFNDAFWKSGPAELGYGDGDEATVVSYGRNPEDKHITTYFRKTISIGDASLYAYFTASIKRDDGVVVYVNGAEVYRNNMPSGAISYTTLALHYSLSDGQTPHSFTIPTNAFADGNNIIAVEIHQSSGSSSDISFDFELSGVIGVPNQASPAVESIVRQSPTSQSTTATSVVYRTTFTETVSGVDAADFTLAVVSGTLSASISGMAAVNTTSTAYDIIVNNIAGTGELRLDLKGFGTGIEDIDGNGIIGGYTGGQTYLIQVSTLVKPLFITEPVRYDSDDPAIWLNKSNPAQSLIIGTDKGDAGALYVFDMQGNILESKVVNLQHPNNVDVAYGLLLGGRKVDIAVVTERNTSEIRIFSLPDMQAIDNGGIPVFEGETSSYREPMGIALYTRSTDGAIFAIVSRKDGPTNGSYLWQYQLKDDGFGKVSGTLVRKFGYFSGSKEIEAVAVDNELGFVYYSDEDRGVRKYFADPAKGNAELALFATSGFSGDREGISIYKMEDGTGYILVSDQGSNEFHIYSREGTSGNPDDHRLVKVVKMATQQSDGSDLVNYPILPDFPNGLFVAMSEDRIFHLYRWEDIAGNSLKISPPNTLLPDLTLGSTRQTSGDVEINSSIPDNQSRNIGLSPSLVRKGAAVTIYSNDRETEDAVVVDINGRQIRSFKLRSKAFVDTGNLPAGIYFVILNNKQKAIRLRFVVAN